MTHREIRRLEQLAVRTAETGACGAALAILKMVDAAYKRRAEAKALAWQRGADATSRAIDRAIDSLSVQ